MGDLDLLITNIRVKVDKRLIKLIPFEIFNLKVSFSHT